MLLTTHEISASTSAANAIISKPHTYIVRLRQKWAEKNRLLLGWIFGPFFTLFRFFFFFVDYHQVVHIFDRQPIKRKLVTKPFCKQLKKRSQKQSMTTQLRFVRKTYLVCVCVMSKTWEAFFIILNYGWSFIQPNIANREFAKKGTDVLSIE